jgi:hypothetical protein
MKLVNAGLAFVALVGLSACADNSFQSSNLAESYAQYSEYYGGSQYYRGAGAYGNQQQLPSAYGQNPYGQGGYGQAVRGYPAPMSTEELLKYQTY